MKRIACPYCTGPITLLRGINCRVEKVEREYDETYMALICKIEMYCGRCGEKSSHVIKHYFTRDFDRIATEYLIDMALYSQDINFSA